MKNQILKFIAKIGIDRFAHLGMAGFCCALCGFFGWIPFTISAVIITVLGILKETVIDSAPDWWDFAAGELGIIIALAALLIEMFI